MNTQKTDTKQKTKTYKKYTIDFTAPLSNKLLTLESVSKYLELNMKINGLKGKLGDSIKINISDKNSILIQVESTLEFSKKYINFAIISTRNKTHMYQHITIIFNIFIIIINTFIII